MLFSQRTILVSWRTSSTPIHPRHQRDDVGVQRRLVFGDLADKFSSLRGIKFHPSFSPYADFPAALTDISPKPIIHGLKGGNSAI